MMIKIQFFLRFFIHNCPVPVSLTTSSKKKGCLTFKASLLGHMYLVNCLFQSIILKNQHINVDSVQNVKSDNSKNINFYISYYTISSSPLKYALLLLYYYYAVILCC